MKNFFVVLSDNLFDSFRRKSPLSIHKNNFLSLFRLAGSSQKNKICLAASRRSCNHCDNTAFITPIKPFIKIKASGRNLFGFYHNKQNYCKLIRIAVLNPTYLDSIYKEPHL